MAEDNFGVFTNMLLRAGISDNSYPVKGCHIWLPYGFEFKEYVFRTVETYVEEAGYSKYQFPRLISGGLIGPVTEHIDDFEDYIFWLRRKDGTPIDVFLNPTGECGVYTMFKKWIRNESDLPLRIYQRNSTFRPHKRPDAMLNGDELMDLLECHSAFATQEEANEEFQQTSEMLGKVHERMGIPYLPLRRPLKGNKPVCVDMISFETHLPSKNRSFNVGVLYNQGQIYSKAFGVQFSRTQGNGDNTHQVTFGISERGVAAMLDLHRDQHGIRLLPEFAPEQISVIPVYGGKDNEIRAYAEGLGCQLGEHYRVGTDLGGNTNAGKKFAAARLRGVPIRIGVSAEDLGSRTVRIYIRTQEATIDKFPSERLAGEMPNFFRLVDDDIKDDSRKHFESQVRVADSSETMREILGQNEIARFNWCGDISCIKGLEEHQLGEFLGSHVFERTKGECLSCGGEASYLGFYSKRSASP